MLEQNNESVEEPRPLRVFAYDGVELFYNIRDRCYVLLDGPRAMYSKMTPETADLARKVLQFHLELRDKYFDLYGGKGQIGVATKEEEWRFRALFDELVERLNRELDPKRYKIVEVGAPEPNPFMAERRR